MAVYTQVVLSPDPLYLQPKSYDARSDRKWFADLISPGAVGAGDYAVTFVSGLTVRVAAGTAYVLGQNVADQGMYRQFVSSTNDLAVGAGHATLPRIDTIILRVMDTAHDASSFSEARLEVVPGTPTSGATLANASGAANLTTLGEGSKSVLALAYVLVPAAAGSLTSTATNIRDIRTLAQVGKGNAGSGGGFPIGATLIWNHPTLPPTSEGTYLVEDGSAISRTTYATWFARIQTQHGVGDGSTTANLPDSRGRTTVGHAPSGGHADHDTIGENDNLAVGLRRSRHKHTINDPGHSHLSFGNAGLNNYSDTAGSRVFGNNSPTNSATTGVTVGPQTGSEPTDTPAFITKGMLSRVA
jgi:microcystin-dependent protein